MRLSKVLKLQNASKINEIISSARSTLNEAPQFFNQVKDEKKKIMYDKIIKLNNWYMKVIGIEEVKQAQDKVMLLQDELSKTREKRREVEVKLNEVNLSRGEIHNEMSKVDKNVDFHRFIELKNQEIEILKLIQPLGQLQRDCDQIERKLFLDLTNAIKEAHQRQRAQVDYTKYIGLVFSVVGSALTFIYATVRKENLKSYIDRRLTSKQFDVGEIEDVLRLNQEVVGEIRELLQESHQEVPIHKTIHKPYLWGLGPLFCIVLLSFR